MRQQAKQTLGRREVLLGLGTGLAVGCGGTADPQEGDSSTSAGSSSGDSGSVDTTTATGETSGATIEGSSTTDPTTSGADGSTEGSESGSTDDCAPSADWAAGGTAAMTMKACYPNPFEDSPASCALVCSTTAGPCTTDDSPLREDISDGLGGLPVRILLRLVDPDCAPISGAEVRVWHTKADGVYSGVTPAGDFCFGDQPDVVDQMFFRGRQVSDRNGVVAFDTCFPGWYSTRAVHVHVQITLDDSTWLISQLLWDDALVSEICGSHPDYVRQGQPDTLNTTDFVFGATDDFSPYIFDVQRMADGVMLASKTLSIRSEGPDCES